MINRLTGYRGRAYVNELTRILNTPEGQAIIDEANEFKRQRDGKILVRDVCEIVLNHQLPFKAVCDWLEGRGVLPTGTYQRMLDRGFKVNEFLQRTQAELTQA